MQNFRSTKIVSNNRLSAFLASLFRKYHISQFVIIIFSILIAQITVWLFFETYIETNYVFSRHIATEVVFLTVSLTLILSPILYYFSYRPLLKTIKNLQVAQKQLESLNQALLVTSQREVKAHQLSEGLLAANQALSQTLDLDAVAETLLDFMFDFVPYDAASILIPTTESKWTVLKLVHYESGRKIEIESSQIFDAESLPSLSSFINKKQSKLVTDIQSAEDWRPWTERKGSCCWLGLPFITDGSVTGICELYKTRPHFFTAEHVQLAEMLIHVAAKALQNAWLFEQVRAGREQLQMLSHRLVIAQEVERQNIARELHDEAGQGLASLLIGLRLLENDVHNPQVMIKGIDRLKRTLDGVSDGLHGLAVRLRPASLDHLGIVPALNQHIEDFADQYHIVAQFESIDINGRFPLEVETAVYRIVQEGLTNIARHGQATRVDILLKNRDDKLVVVIEDNGIGFIPEAVNKSKHLGLVGIAERVEMFNGTMTIESTPGEGTTLFIEVPYETARTHY